MRHRGQKDLHCQLNWNSEGPGDQPQRQSWIFNQEQQLLQDNYHAGSKTWSTHVIFELFQIIYSILLVTTFLCLVSKITNICSWWQCNRLLYNLCSTVSMGKGKGLCTRTGNVEGEKKKGESVQTLYATGLLDGSILPTSPPLWGSSFHLSGMGSCKYAVARLSHVQQAGIYLKHASTELHTISEVVRWFVFPSPLHEIQKRINEMTAISVCTGILQILITMTSDAEYLDSN